MKSNIRQLRKERNISQAMLGEVIGLSQQVVSRIERDRSKIPVDVLMNLADYFDVSTDCVLGYQRKSSEARPLERALMMQSAVSEEMDDEMNDEILTLEQKMDQEHRLLLWQLLIYLKKCL